MSDTKIIVITGGTGGIGLQAAIGLAEQGHTIVVTGRSKERGEAGVATIKATSGHEDVHLALGDLSEPEGRGALAEDLLSRFERIDVLLNNAGMLATEFRRTSQGTEIDFAVNVIAPYDLTQRLLPALEAAPGARVINVTGGMPNDRLDPPKLQSEQGFVALPSYSHTKRAMEAMSLVQAEELADKGVHVNVVYPGAASTAMTGAMSSGALPWWMRPFWPVFRAVMQKDDGGKSAAKAARSSIWAATTPELDGVHGRYYDTKCRPATFSKSVQDAANQRQVMEAVRATL